MNCFDPRGSGEGRVSIFLSLRGTKLNVSENGGMNSIFEEQNPHFILEPSKTTTLKDQTFLFIMTERFYHIMGSASNTRLRHEVLLNHNSTVKPPSPEGCKGGIPRKGGGWGGGIIAQ